MDEDIELIEVKPRKGRGQGKKTLEEEAARALRDAPNEVPTVQRSPAAPSVASLLTTGQYASSGSAALLTKRGAPPRRVARASRAAADDLFPEYRRSVESRDLGFYQIDQRTWVAELCDLDTMDTFDGVDAWTVLRSEVDAHERVSYSCSPCPDFKLHQRCVHTMLLSSDDVPPFRAFSEVDNPTAVLFEHRRATAQTHALCMFLCNTVKKGAVIVSYYGCSDERGEWACSAHRTGGCRDINTARKNAYFQQLFGRTGDDETDDEAAEDEQPIREERERVDKQSLLDLYDERSISYRPVGPPLWARVAGDKSPTFDLVDPIPAHFDLGADPRCRCGAGPNLTAEERVVQSVLYTSARSYNVTVSIRPCATCPPGRRQDAGPDLREYGIFNFNNARLYSHELLNGFTNAMTTFEAPFHSYRTLVHRNYISNHSPRDFVTDNTWRTAWFSFTRVQRLQDSFQCPECGPDPEVVIFDGVTAGFSARHCTSSLRPPTMVEPNGPVRVHVQPQGDSQMLIPGPIRAKAQRAVRWRLNLTKGNKSRLAADGDATSDDEEDGDVVDEDANVTGAERQAAKRRRQRDQEDKKMRESIPSLAKSLHGSHAGLAVVFGVHVSSEWREDREGITRMYLELLEQLLAYESVLQFAPFSAWPHLHLLATKGDDTAIDALLPSIPALARVARFERLAYTGGVTKELRDIASFVLDSAKRARAKLGNHDPEDAKLEVPKEEDWRETGTFYGRDRQRDRPMYPHLPTDCATDRATVSDSGGAIGCNKFFQKYGKWGLTGGLMVAWCTHSVCIGFHCIPKGEGRNDVFSALFTHWKKAPRYVIYDFACALAPYCMLREPIFFGDTIFLIDCFHSEGHTRCSPACFIRAYKEWNAKLAFVNSSAGECGNAGIAKIRRPISYMSQRHAVIFSYIFLAIWNRQRRRILEARLPMPLRKSSTAATVDASRSKRKASSASRVAVGRASASASKSRKTPQSPVRGKVTKRKKSGKR